MGIGRWLHDTFGPITEVVPSFEPESRTMLPATLDLRSANAGGLFNPTWVNNKPQWLPNTLETNDQQGFRRIPLIFRCIKFVADSSSSAPLRVYDYQSNQEQEIADHPLRLLLKRPNVGMGEARFLSFCVMTMQVAGFVVLEKERDRLGNVIGLWPLRSDWIRPIPRAGGVPPDWEYKVPGMEQPFTLLAEDVIPITYQDTPDYRPTGIGPLEVALREVGIMNTLTDFIKAFFDRGALPMLWAFISQDPRLQKAFEDPATKAAFEEGFNQRYGGIDNAARVGIAAGIDRIEKISYSLDELAYPELRKLNEIQICSVFGVSPILLDTQVGSENSTYNNKSEARRSFFEDFMTFLWARIDDAFTRHLLPEFDPDGKLEIAFDVSEIPALKEDRDKQWSRGMLAWKAGGIMMNEYRREIGLKPIDGGDVFIIPVGVQIVRLDQLPELGKEPEPVDEQQPDPQDQTDETQDEQDEGERGIRSVPPITEDDVLVSQSDVDRAIADFDKQFPDFAGLLNASVEGDE